MEETPQSQPQEQNDKLTPLIYQIVTYLACAGIGGSLAATISANIQLAKIDEQISGIKDHIADIDLRTKRIYLVEDAEKDQRIRDERIQRLERRVDEIQQNRLK